MALDRQSIEKKDFPVGRRGYDPDAVDAHLAVLADEVEQLRRSARSRTDTLASSASDQVRAIVQAAETSAADIQREAEDEAREIRDEASAEARSTRTRAAEQARDYVEQISQTSESMLTRLASMQTEIDALLGSLRTGAGRLSGELKALQSELEDGRDAVAPRRAFEPEPPAGASEPDEVFSEPEPEPEPEPELAPGEPDEPALVPDELTPVAVDAAPDEDETEGARLIALNMALNGTPRDETARYLHETFGISDSAAMLDEVYSSVDG